MKRNMESRLRVLEAQLRCRHDTWNVRKHFFMSMELFERKCYCCGLTQGISKHEYLEMLKEELACEKPSRIRGVLCPKTEET